MCNWASEEFIMLETLHQFTACVMKCLQHIEILASYSNPAIFISFTFYYKVEILPSSTMTASETSPMPVPAEE